MMQPSFSHITLATNIELNNIIVYPFLTEHRAQILLFQDKTTHLNTTLAVHRIWLSKAKLKLSYY
jgi:hypothetical protein